MPKADGVRRGAHWWFAWWYLALAIGFTLLGIAHVISGGERLMTAVRFVLALGFAILSKMEFSARKRR